jgi:hypothetical protein
MVKKNLLANGWTMVRVPNPHDNQLSIHISASKGDCRVHRDGDHAYTAYLANPFVSVGVFPSSSVAMKECEKYERD